MRLARILPLRGRYMVLSPWMLDDGKFYRMFEDREDAWRFRAEVVKGAHRYLDAWGVARGKVNLRRYVRHGGDPADVSEFLTRVFKVDRGEDATLAGLRDLADGGETVTLVDGRRVYKNHGKYLLESHRGLYQLANLADLRYALKRLRAGKDVRRSEI